MNDNAKVYKDSAEFYKDMDDLFNSFIDILNNFDESKVLQDFYIYILDSFFYATIIDNFFHNLNPKNLKESGLLDLAMIKKEYEDIQKDIDLIIKLKEGYGLKTINEKYYNDFKTRLESDFPELIDLLSKIEKDFFDINKFKRYLIEKEVEIKKSGRFEKDFSSNMITSAVEIYTKKNHEFPFDDNFAKMMELISEKVIPNVADELYEHFKINSKEILIEQNEYKKEFETRLYDRWKEPLDLLDGLIRISLESVDNHSKRTIKEGSEDFKIVALLKIHARALHIANEILALLKAGYPDGAFSRWRSLHELAVISFFLNDNDCIVSKRYLEHETVTIYKDARDYQKYCEELGESPLEIEYLKALKEEKERLCNKYDRDYHKTWGWIPSSIINDKHFRSLEKHIGLDRLHPYYNWSSAKVHGSSRGLRSMGLMDKEQNAILIVGPSNYGLADPLQNTAISLMHVSICLLNLCPDLESITQMKIIQYFVDEIGEKAVEIQKEIEKEDSSNGTDNQKEKSSKSE